MKRVFKQILQRKTGVFTLNIPLDRFLSMQVQDNDLAIWFLADDDKDEELKEYHYMLCFTGQDFDALNYKYLSTAQGNSGLVWHLFYIKNTNDLIHDMVTKSFGI